MTAATSDMTLSLHGRSGKKPGEPVPQPLLVVALECSRPGAQSARHSLAGIDQVLLGRGSARTFDRRTEDAGHTLALKIPDRWMSSAHARLEHSFGRWILEDAGSKNGTIVNGAITDRAVLSDGDVFELGHTLFLFRNSLGLDDGDELDIDLEGAAETTPGLTTIVPSFARVLSRLEKIAPAEISVLLSGESGTGKEVLARAIHTLSGRKGEFVPVNCGAIPANLVESELFGHRKGSFSGAIDDRPGLVRAADGGTLFLDEIGDLPTGSQAALLRVLQEREVQPLGETRAVPVDLRLVAATHQNLDEMVARGEFRQDLFARIVGFRVNLPPLRQRLEDLGHLIGTLLARKASKPASFEVEAARLLFGYSWPLNIRELENCLSTAVVLADDAPIAPEHLPHTVRGARSAPPKTTEAATLSAADRELKSELEALLVEHRGNVSAIARSMEKDRKQIQRWLRRFALDAALYRD